MANEINIKGIWKAIDVDLDHEYTFNSTSNTWEVSNGGELTSGKFIYFIYNLDTHNIAYLGDFTFENGALSSGNNYNHVSGIYRIAEDVKAVGIIQFGQLRVISDGNNDGTVFGMADSTIYGEVASSDFVAPDATDISSLSTDIFAGPIVKTVAAFDTYNSSKKYVYKDQPGKYQTIQDESHFNCIQNGYWELQNPEYTEYFTEDGDKFIHHIVPDTSTWQGKLDFSNTIAGLTLFNIPTDDPKIYDMQTNSYYDRVQDSEDYKKVTEFQEFKVLDPLEIDWDHPYTCRKENKDGETLYIWSQQNEQQNEQQEGENEQQEGEGAGEEQQQGGPLLAETGQYLYIQHISEINRYAFGFFHVTFDSFGNNEGRVPQDVKLYKLPNGFDSIYLLGTADSAKLKKLNLYNDTPPWPEGINKLTKLTLSIPDSSYNADTAKFYSSQFLWSYPNAGGPASPVLTNDDNEYLQYTEEEYPSYTACASRIPVDTKWNNPYAIFKKTAKIINYRYTDSGSAQPLQLIFTDKKKAEVLSDCGLTQTDLQGVDISDYVHLTNLEYKRRTVS